MRIPKPVCILAAACLALAAGSAQGGIFRAYLALGGNDANPCTLPQPCRLLPAALTAVNDGGEIWMLDSANYNIGPVLVDKSVKILAVPGEMGSIVANGGDAVVINAPGKDVTLRNLFVLNLAGGTSGINILAAEAVHVEKTTIHDFTSDSGACIRAVPSTAVRLFVADSFMRHCRAGIHAHQPVGLSPRQSIMLDNTRIERGASAGGPTFGVIATGCVDLLMRNSYIARNVIGVLSDGLVAGCAPHFTISQSQITNNTTGLSLANETAGAQLTVSVAGSQITNHTDAIAVLNGVGGTGALIDLHLMEAMVTQCGNACVALANGASDNSNGIRASIERSHIGNAVTGIDAAAPNGSRVRVYLRDSTLMAASGRLIRTAGAGINGVRVNLIRSNFNHSPKAIEHGYGIVTLDGCSFMNFTDLFVNVGSADIRSYGNNSINFYDNNTGATYITPTPLAQQ